MREYPVTVSSHVYHINSSASNLFDDDQYQRKLPTIETDINCGRFHQTSTAQCNNNKTTTAANYICTSNGDLTSLQSGRLQNFSNINNIHNNNCNRSHKIAVKSSNDNKSSEPPVDGRGDADENNDGNRAANGNGSYSIFDAITNAVTTGHCVNSVYPVNERNENDFDQINLSNPDPLTAAASTSIHSQKNATAHLNNECGQFQHYNYHFNAARTHQFPSANYKHSYLLWIGTPVAARYC